MKTKIYTKQRIRIVLLTISFILINSVKISLFAQDIFTWTGVTDNNWANSTNWAKTGAAGADTYPGQTRTTDNAVISNGGTPALASTVSLASVAISNATGATSGSVLTINAGASLTVSGIGTTATSAIVLQGGNIVNNGTLAVTTSSTSAGYGLICSTPVVAPTSATTYSYTGSGTLSINTSAGTGGAVLFNGANANSTYKIAFPGTSNTTLSLANNTNAITVASGATSPVIISGAGFSLGSATTGVHVCLLNQSGGTNVTIDTGTTITNYLQVNTATGTRSLYFNMGTGNSSLSFTNNGSIYGYGTANREFIYINNNGSTGTGVTNIATITNNGTIATDLNVNGNAGSGVNSGIIAIVNGSNSSNKININNAGTMTLKNTGSGTGLGYALWCSNNTAACATTITNSGTFELNGTATSTGGLAGKVTLNNTGTVNILNSGLDVVTFNNNNVGILDCKTNSVTSGTNYVVTLNAGSTLKTARQGGLTCLAGTGAVVNSGVNFVFNGAIAQSTGSLLTTANNIQINNSLGVTLSANTTVNGILTLTSGSLSYSTFTLTLANGASIAKSGGYLAAVPTFGSSLNLSYSGSATKSNEFPASDIINILTVNNFAGITLSDNRNLSTLSIGSGSSLTVNAGKQLTVSGSMSNSGTLNLLSDNTGANGTATIITPATITENAATYNVQQYITSAATGVTRRNWYISSPLSAATSATITSATGNSLVYYDGTTNWPAAGTTMDVMKGYIAVTPAQNTTINFTGGTLNTGDKSVSNLPLGFNLVGNPYPSSVDFAQATKTNVANSIWYRSKKTGSYNFHTYNVTGGVSVNDGTAIIAPMQAFWIKTTSATNTLGFTNIMRTHQDQSVVANRLMAPKANTQQLLRLQVSNSVNKDETVIYFNAAAQNTVDDYDAQKMFNNTAEVPEIFTKIEGTSLAINGMNSIPYDTEIPLGFSTGEAGNFNIAATEFKNFESGTRIILKDILQPTSETDLSAGSDYNFSAQSTTSTADRFSLVFRAPGAITGVDNTAKTNVKVFVNAANQISIIAPEKSIYSIYNAVGQLIENGILNTERETRDAKHLAAGVYVVKVNNQSTRIIVK